MSTVYDCGPIAEPSDDEIMRFGYLHHQFMVALRQRFGRGRTEVLIDWYCTGYIANALCNYFEPAKRWRILSDLNEAIRQEQEESDAKNRWVLIPTLEP